MFSAATHAIPYRSGDIWKNHQLTLKMVGAINKQDFAL
jgi:hypothetical protein